MTVMNTNYKSFVETIKSMVSRAQYEALKKVNKELINLYWNIGKAINEKQSELGWGKSVVEQLAKDLQAELPGIKGFSAANLWRMGNFYSIYNNNIKLAPLVREISWTKNVIIIEKCKDEASRHFYITMTKKFGWTKNVLINKIDSKDFERFALNQTNFDANLPKLMQSQAKLAVKDEYTFEISS